MGVDGGWMDWGKMVWWGEGRGVANAVYIDVAPIAGLGFGFFDIFGGEGDEDVGMWWGGRVKEKNMIYEKH